MVVKGLGTFNDGNTGGSGGGGWTDQEQVVEQVIRITQSGNSASLWIWWTRWTGCRKIKWFWRLVVVVVGWTRQDKVEVVVVGTRWLGKAYTIGLDGTTVSYGWRWRWWWWYDPHQGVGGWWSYFWRWIDGGTGQGTTGGQKMEDQDPSE